MRSRLRVVRLTLIGLLLLLASEAQADADEPESGLFALKGVGQRSCAMFLEARTAGSPLYLQFGSWLSGYLSAYNQQTPDTVDIAPWQTMDLLAAYLANYCGERPESTVFEGANQLTAVLHPHRIRGQTEIVTIEREGDVVEIYTAVVGQIQEVLSERGYYDGEIDRMFGPMTRQALEGFQSDQNLPVSGMPDERTLHTLFNQE